MIVIPAVDIRGGNVVRLFRGDFSKETVYSSDPVKTSLWWQSEGAKRLHVVDLDGALEGKLKNLDWIRKITASLDIPIEAGGGIRTEADLQTVIRAGASYAILGTKACEDEEFLKRAVDKYREKIIVSLDVKDGYLQTKGWVNPTEIKAIDFAQRIRMFGVQTVEYTDISRDGTLQGPGFGNILKFLGEVKIDMIVSGGISTLADLRILRDYNRKEVVGVIVGRALYDKKILLKDANKVCSQKG
ncbi:MAG TPA: 1-(5-phosphoribosyl)-5-[(5-phosphoribosylamino)methylideneamino]imidazole-4-carboxamide isomerase [Candidatus Omnitrophota bacterium]|nr:1-(5-phosphoribosyl)-5-[(5-phosphoribosylamino)methylideneamino]imidazole-4-carboxamide isomerase [Candidatus Omnitrophota bacterium]HOX09740.1 1-(5-phosphoribosyl)-5-[(5-phosphoribosylamino)methylideneamino]imidazole-4-carboxamide isomerase [Candidatus Omnitrophota bacterium]HPN66431.1 1-(5-phosphoribosyl)-5-[(5-phosphoribosylamino)methylideneamino]imidazole-4-carboxamide isomerase [Candidatus Omnitrophota bacterium]